MKRETDEKMGARRFPPPWSVEGQAACGERTKIQAIDASCRWKNGLSGERDIGNAVGLYNEDSPHCRGRTRRLIAGNAEFSAAVGAG